jgi:iron complex transport system ATP-binding protein
MTAGRLDIEDLSFSYLGHGDTPVFSGVNLTLAPGDVFCLLGPNGAGKSTFLKCLARLLPPLTGRVAVDNEDLAGLSTGNIARNMGFVPQNMTPAFPFSVADIVVMGRARKISLVSSPSAGDREAAMGAMEDIGISHLADRPCNRLSGGEWQMVLIARALTQSPKILLLDEPTAHLDLGNQIKILETVADLAQTGMTIVMASHFPDHAFICADHAGILRNGRLKVQGPPEDVLTGERLGRAFGISIRVVDIPGKPERKICVPLVNSKTEKENSL